MNANCGLSQETRGNLHGEVAVAFNTGSHALENVSLGRASKALSKSEDNRKVSSG